MKTLHTVMTLAAMFTLGACSTEPSGTLSSAPEATAETEQNLALLDCSKQVAACTKSAKSFSDFGKCTTDFQACTAQAALDVLGQGNLATDCRSKANNCLKGAVTLSDISACREIFGACTTDITGVAGDVLGNALKIAGDAISKASDVATKTIDTATGDVSAALDAVGACETKANACLKSVVKLSDISPCEQTFDTCTSKAISLVDKVVSPLPIPTPSQILDGLTQCQEKSTQCLKGALTVSDVSACKSVLTTCVKNASSVVDTTVSGVTSILPIKLPGVGQTVDCTGGLAECLLKLGNPVDCAAQATTCETK